MMNERGALCSSGVRHGSFIDCAALLRPWEKMNARFAREHLRKLQISPHTYGGPGNAGPVFQWSGNVVALLRNVGLGGPFEAQLRLVINRIDEKILNIFLAFSAFSLLPAAEKVPVATLSTILTEIGQNVGGEHVAVSGLVKPGIGHHEFTPKPSDLAAIAQAQLVLASGKHMEGYHTRLPESSGSKGRFLEVGNAIPSLQMTPKEGEVYGTVAANGKIEDPPWWHSIENVKLATGIIRDAFSKISPSNKAVFEKHAAACIGKLVFLEKWAKHKVAELPCEKRKLVTLHDAFHYFAHDFGFTTLPIEGLNPDDEPSALKVTVIIETIKKENVKAIFGGFGNNPKVIQVNTYDTHAKIAGKLYADGLGFPDSTAAIYDGMMRRNIIIIVDALK